MKSSATGTWFQTPEAYDFFAQQPSLFRPFVVAIEKSKSRAKSQETRELRGVCVGYVTREKSAIKQYFTRRAIIVGGPALANDATAEEVETLMRALRGLVVSGLGAPIYIETRNFNDYSSWRSAFEKAGFTYRPHLNFHMDCTDARKMWERLSETRRRQVRKARATGVTVEKAGREEDIAAWYAILAELYRMKVKTPLFPLSFFLEFYRQKKGEYLLVKYEGKIIGGMMCPIMGEQCIYEWFICGLDTDYKKQYPSVMATYAAMEYAAQHGIARFDIMGAGEPGVPYGVRDFKAEFGGQLVEHGRYLYIAKPALYAIGVWGVKMLKRW